MGHMRLGSVENSSKTNSDNELYSRIPHPSSGGRGVTTPLPLPALCARVKTQGITHVEDSKTFGEQTCCCHPISSCLNKF